MSFTWEKLGRVYSPPADGLHPKLHSHTANPLPIPLKGNVFRVFYSGRDCDNRSSVGAVDIDLATGEVLECLPEPVLLHGEEGSYYADGISLGNYYASENGRFILFMAWQNTPGRHWRGDIGRIKLEDDHRLTVEPGGPFLAADEEDPISLSYPWVTRYADGHYRMWYGSTISWDTGSGEMLHVIKQATSADGKHWEKQGLAIEYELGRAQAYSRPTVLVAQNGHHHMWYSFRGGSGTPYRIGYARSKDGNDWKVADEQSGISVSQSGWDSEMVAYPYVFRHAGNTYLLYNGNDYGRSGFGLARLDGKLS